METFSALLAICAGNSPVPGEFPTQRPVTRSFDVYFDLRPDKRLSKQLWGWWFETLSHSLWRHRNEMMACGLFGAKPLSDTMPGYCWRGPWEYKSVTLELKYNKFHSIKFIWKSRLHNGGHFCLDRHVLKSVYRKPMRRIAWGLL